MDFKPNKQDYNTVFLKRCPDSIETVIYYCVLIIYKMNDFFQLPIFIK